MNANFKRILFATDGSDYSAGAQRLAFQLAKRCGAEFHVMSIMLSTQDLEGVGTQHMREEREREINERLEKVASAAGAVGLGCTMHLVYGETPEHEIVNTAASLEADLVVLGRRGTRGMARFMVGHATAWVAGHAGCPVLVVPRSAEMWKTRVLFATDGSVHSAAAAEAARRMAKACGLPALAVSATSRSHSEERRAEASAVVDAVAAEFGRDGIECEGVVVEGRPDEVVIETAASRQADLIVVGSHGRTGLTKLFLGSISERIMGQAQCPVLVARAEA